MTGYSPGFLGSIIHNTDRHYRIFSIPKGRSSRQIEAPRVGLKFIQKWLATQFEIAWRPRVHDSVHGFVRGRSHISAASVHLGCDWVVSVDIQNFFPSTDARTVHAALSKLGYACNVSLDIVCRICCYKRRLPQGAPTSPVLSNIALHHLDHEIATMANKSNWSYTRYADDIVLSGSGPAPEGILDNLEELFSSTCWRLSPDKRSVAQSPQRLKVHGLLVHGDELRLTKGYRNRIRAYRHLQKHGTIHPEHRRRIEGHIGYADQIERYIMNRLSSKAD